jgi:hypothetical protein
MSMNPLARSASVIALTLAGVATIAHAMPSSGAYFSSTDSMAGNSLQTDVVKVKVDYGHDYFTNVMDYTTAPGSSYGISAAFINQSLTFPIRGFVSVKDQGSDQVLWDALTLNIHEGNNGPVVYSGPLNKLGVKKLKDKNGFDVLINPGQESSLYSFVLTLPETGQDQNALMGKHIKFSWDFTGSVGPVDLTQNL